MKCLAARKQKKLDKIKDGVIKADTDLIHMAAVSVLAEKYGFGYEKIMNIKKYLDDRADSILEAYIDIKDLEEILLEEYGIDCKGYFPEINRNSIGQVITSVAINSSMRFYIVGLASVLTDKYGYGKQKVQQIIKSILSRLDDLFNHRISMDEIKQMLILKYSETERTEKPCEN